MGENSEIIEKTFKLSKMCRVPQLLHELDTKPISKDDFKEFNVAANENIYCLLDIIHQNPYILSEKSYDNQSLQIKMNLILITCEQRTFFAENDRNLLDGLWKTIIDNMKFFEDEVFQQIISCCKESLTNNGWKKHIGLIHAFPLLFEIILKHKMNIISNDVLMFGLSIGANLVAHYDPQLKTIGLNIYMHLVKHVNCKRLMELNIHKVIYSEVYPLIQRSSDLNYNIYLYECLVSIIKLENIKDYPKAKWCPTYDNVISKLITHFSFENEQKLSRFLMYQLVRILAIGCSGKVDMKPLEELEEINLEYFTDLKSQITAPNYRAMRWINKLMEMMTRESHRILNNEIDAKFFLSTFNMLYIISINSISPEDFQNVLEEFTKKFILTLMKIANSYSKNRDVLNLILCLLTTIEEHQSSNENLVFVLQKLQKHEVFM